MGLRTRLNVYLEMVRTKWVTILTTSDLTMRKRKRILFSSVTLIMTLSCFRLKHMILASTDWVKMLLKYTRR